MTLLSNDQLKTINTLFSKLAIGEDQKRDMIGGFAGGRTRSSRQLTKEEATQLVRHLKSLDPDEVKAERMRRKIISMAHEMHWQKPRSNDIDMTRVDGWCRNYGFGKKPLNAYTIQELPKLVAQFENGPYKTFLNPFAHKPKRERFI